MRYLKSVVAGGLGGVLATAGMALAQDTGVGPAPVETAAAVIDKGDVAWMLISTVLVLFMVLPGLGLFYGGLVRAKNMLSVLMQCVTICAVVMIIYVVYGYSLAFGGSTSPYWAASASCSWPA